MYLGFADFQMDIRLAIVLELKKWGFRIPEINTLKEDFELVKTYRNALEGIKTQIEILKKEVIEEAKEDTRNLYDDLITVSRALQLGYRINPKDTLLPEWLSMCKRLKEISKQN